jgi:hypothetical protein
LGGISFQHKELKAAYTARVHVKQLLLSAAIGDEMELVKNIYPCCIRSFELLMMDEKTVRNMQRVLQE